MKNLLAAALAATLALSFAACSKKEESGESKKEKKKAAPRKDEKSRPGEAARNAPPRPDARKAGPAAAGPEYKLYKNDNGRFSVTAPGVPKTQSTKVPTAAGVLDYHIFMFFDKSASCGGAARGCVLMASYSDYPPKLIKKSNIQKILDGGRDGMVKKVKGKLLKEDKIVVDGHHGRMLHIEAPAPPAAGGKMIIRAKAILVANRVYIMQAVTAFHDRGSPGIKKFLDSVKVWAKK